MARINFNSEGNLYVATKSVSSDFAIHLESDIAGTYEVKQKSDPDATRPALTDVYSNRTELDAQYKILVPATIVITSTVPIAYGSIIEA